MENYSFDDILLPVYIVNLEKRTDRLKHILKQFEGKPEFELHIVPAVENTVGAVGLWESLLKCIKMAMKNDDDFIIFCEDDHVFTEAYDRNFLISNILEANKQGCDILSGGVGYFGHAIPITSHRYWVSNFWSTQFVVIFRDIFEALVNEPYDESVTADGKISTITENKMVLYPFISIQNDFGYSDVTKLNNEMNYSVSDLFKKASERLALYKNAYENYVMPTTVPAERISSIHSKE